MEPTLMSGDRVLFVRKPWRINSIVLADVGEDALVVKRVLSSRNDYVFICGDNKEESEDYFVNTSRILGVMLWHVPLKLPCCETR